MQKLLSLGASPDPRNKQGLTPLIMAAARGCGAAVVHLVQAGADPGLLLSGGATVLHICADMGLREVKEVLGWNGRDASNETTIADTERLDPVPTRLPLELYVHDDTGLRGFMNTSRTDQLR